jgi:superfamily II DNA or RNA helicase
MIVKNLRDYQIEAVKLGLTQSLFINHDCGLGKTYTAVRLIVEYRKRVAPKPMLIVAPKGIISQWLNELGQADLSQYVHVIDVKSDPSGCFIKDPHIIQLMHYEAMVRHCDLLCCNSYGLMILDECHRIKDARPKKMEDGSKIYGSQRSVAAWKIRKHADRGIGLSGTMFDKQVDELFGILRFINPKQFTYFWNFYDRYCNEVLDEYGYPHVDGVKNLITFQKEIGHYVHTRKMSDVAQELPPLIETIIDVPMLPQQAKLYGKLAAEKKLTEFNFDMLDDDLYVSSVLEELLRLQQIATDPSLIGSNVKSGKLEWLKDWLADHERESVLVFTKFVETAERIGALHQLPVVAGSGKPVDHRKESRIVATIDKMSEGYDCPHIRNVIFVDIHWSSIRMDQAVKRVQRLGITESKNIIILRSALIDDIVYRLWHKKQESRTEIENLLKRM